MRSNPQPSIFHTNLCLVGALLVALATGTAHADTVRFGLRVIADGDSSGKLLDVAGRPDSTRHVKASKKHVEGGERWVYHRDGRNIEFTLHDGVVTAIVEHRGK